MPASPVPVRHGRSDGTEPFAAFPAWFLRIECDRCGNVQIVNEAHAQWRG